MGKILTLIPLICVPVGKFDNGITVKPIVKPSENFQELEREVFLAFWKIHVLHHAKHEPVVGQWAMEELRRHGYTVSPGTLYPLLARLTTRGWLVCRVAGQGGPRARKEYTLTKSGRAALEVISDRLIELHREVILEKKGGGGRS